MYPPWVSLNASYTIMVQYQNPTIGTLRRPYLDFASHTCNRVHVHVWGALCSLITCTILCNNHARDIQLHYHHKAASCHPLITIPSPFHKQLTCSPNL